MLLVSRAVVKTSPNDSIDNYRTNREGFHAIVPPKLVRFVDFVRNFESEDFDDVCELLRIKGK